MSRSDGQNVKDLATDLAALKEKVDRMGNTVTSDLLLKIMSHLGVTKCPDPMDLTSVEVLTNPVWWAGFFDATKLTESDLVTRFDEKSAIEAAFRHRLQDWSTNNGQMTLTNYIASRIMSICALFSAMARAYVRFPTKASVLQYLKENDSCISEAIKYFGFLARERLEFVKPGVGKFVDCTLMMQKRDFPSFVSEAVDTAVKIRLGIGDAKRPRDAYPQNHGRGRGFRGRGRGATEGGRGRGATEGGRGRETTDWKESNK